MAAPRYDARHHHRPLRTTSRTRPAWKKTFGHHPLPGFWTTPTPPAVKTGRLLRPGNVGPHTAADHVTHPGLGAGNSASHPLQSEPGRSGAQQILVRSDSVGATHTRCAWPREWGSPSVAPSTPTCATRWIFWRPRDRLSGGIRDGALGRRGHTSAADPPLAGQTRLILRKSQQASDRLGGLAAAASARWFHRLYAGIEYAGLPVRRLCLLVIMVRHTGIRQGACVNNSWHSSPGSTGSLT